MLVSGCCYLWTESGCFPLFPVVVLCEAKCYSSELSIKLICTSWLYVNMKLDFYTVRPYVAVV